MLNDHYIIPEREIQRYIQHGIAHLRINDMPSRPLSSCSIDVSALLEISQPRHVWMKETPKAPRIVLASERVTNIPDNSTLIDPGRKFVSLDLLLSHSHPKKDYEYPELVVGYE